MGSGARRRAPAPCHSDPRPPPKSAPSDPATCPFPSQPPRPPSYATIQAPPSPHARSPLPPATPPPHTLLSPLARAPPTDTLPSPPGTHAPRPPHPHPRMKRIKLALPPVDEKKKVIEDVDKDRRYAIEAAIVRTMKSRKQMQHQQLVLEVVSQLSRMFKVGASSGGRCGFGRFGCIQINPGCGAPTASV